MLGLTVAVSISAMVFQNCIFNNVSKKELKTNDSIYKYNMCIYAVCLVFFGLMMIKEGMSLYTLTLGLVFGVVTALSNFYKVLSLSKGPMHITLLVTTSSMIIPTLSGVFFGETFSMTKLCFVFVLIFFVYLSLDRTSDKSINKSWLICCMIAFVMQGTIGVLQKIHQTSDCKNELNFFLFVSFCCSAIFNRIRIKGKFSDIKLGKKTMLLALFCGVCTYLNNFLNLKLSGLIPSQVFFPLVNGSTIVLCSLASVIIFKEKLTKIQVIGLCGGILSLVAICMVK
ncbi:MAG: EamA family transporter [Clostridia bacterium]|nr:EamA family transporter [Clostridia bacterium]